MIRSWKRAPFLVFRDFFVVRSFVRKSFLNNNKNNTIKKQKEISKQPPKFSLPQRSRVSSEPRPFPSVLPWPPLDENTELQVRRASAFPFRFSPRFPAYKQTHTHVSFYYALDIYLLWRVFFFATVCGDGVFILFTWASPSLRRRRQHVSPPPPPPPPLMMMMMTASSCAVCFFFSLLLHSQQHNNIPPPTRTSTRTLSVARRPKKRKRAPHRRRKI